VADQIITPEIQDILNRSIVTESKLILPNEQLDRKLYVAVNNVLENIGGKWNRKEKAHIFTSDPRPKLNLVMEAGKVIDEKKLYQAFFTPALLAKQVAEMAEVQSEYVLEPSAGNGSLAKACLDASAIRIIAVELNPAFIGELKQVISYEDGSIIEGNFLDISVSDIGKFSRVVMNPPFTKNQDIKHISHALNFLDTGGILTSIVMGDERRTALSKFLGEVMAQGLAYHAEPLPENSFKESGTLVKSSVLQIFK